MTKQKWASRFKKEFGIHFSLSEFQFAKEFISEQIIKIKAEEREKIEKLIAEEIVIAQKEGQPTSRLTALYNKIC